MTRRIARGLFRLWLVASVAWVCAVRAVTWWVMPPADSKGIKVPDRKAAIQTAAEMALIAPALTLVFGAALGWAIRGFRDLPHDN